VVTVAFLKGIRLLGDDALNAERMTRLARAHDSANIWAELPIRSAMTTTSAVVANKDFGHGE
jgi:hypothetical protein